MSCEQHRSSYFKVGQNNLPPYTHMSKCTYLKKRDISPLIRPKKRKRNQGCKQTTGMRSIHQLPCLGLSGCKQNGVLCLCVHEHMTIVFLLLCLWPLYFQFWCENKIVCYRADCAFSILFSPLSHALLLHQ